jgi:hypothetical protein
MEQQAAVSSAFRRLLLAAVMLGVALTSAAGASAAGAGAVAVAGARYIGSASQRQATVIVVSRDARTITALLTTIACDGVCGKGAGGAPYQILSNRRFAIHSNGSFAVTTSGTTTEHGALPMLVTGAFSANTVHGTTAETGVKANRAAPRQAHNPYRATFSPQATLAGGS